MNIAEVKAVLELSSRSRGAEGESDKEKSVRLRDLAETVKKLNEAGSVGADSELQLTVDEGTGQPLIRIVDRITDEVITQFPPESALRTAEVLRSLRPGDRIA